MALATTSLMLALTGRGADRARAPIGFRRPYRRLGGHVGAVRLAPALRGEPLVPLRVLANPVVRTAAIASASRSAPMSP